MAPQSQRESIAMMRLRLVHTLSLVLVVFVFTALVAFGGLLAWNLHRGFASYLVARDTDQLERFAAVVADYIGQDGGMALRNHRLDFGKILDEFALREGLPRARPPDPPGMPPEGPLPDGPREFPAPESFAGRLSVHDPAGNLLAGPPLASSAAGVTRRPIVVGGSVVATVSLRPAPPVPSSVETDFLRHQFIGITLLTACLLGFSLVAARALAGWLARPLLAMKAATTRMAHGDLSVRVDNRRTDEIGDLAANLNGMAESLARLEGARRRWIAEISHELRTPLTVLRGELAALTDGVRLFGADALASLSAEVATLGQLVDDLHLLAMADINALRCHYESFDAVAFFEGLHAKFTRAANSQGLELKLETPAQTSLAVRWDPHRIQQLISNLLQNSVHYTDSPGRIRLAYQHVGARVLVCIDDSAPTVPDQDLPRLFEPLYRADAARRRQRGGSGLGLSICAAITRAHGGTISGSQSDFGGLRIRIELPVVPEQAA
jgi:two-component system sensor histidine kinase BaeS